MRGKPRKYFIPRKALFDKISDSAVRDSTKRCHIDGAQYLTSDDNAVRSSCISHLSVSRCPNTISWLVAFVIVNALDCVLPCWLPAHVGKEGGKRVSPPLADGNAPATVFFVCRVCLVVATRLDMKPCGVFDGLRAASFLSMNTFCGRHYFSTKTPATTGVSCFERWPKDRNVVSAVASAKPDRLAIVVHPLKPNGDKPTKSLAGYVLKITRVSPTLGSSHDATFRKKVVNWLEPADVQPSVRLAL